MKDILENVSVVQIVHELNLFEHAISIGPVLVALQNHDFSLLAFVLDLGRKEKKWV